VNDVDPATRVFGPDPDLQAVWDTATATRACLTCGVPAGVACVPPGYRPHRTRYDGHEPAPISHGFLRAVRDDHDGGDAA
jgi:hypothetical protein